VKLDGKEVVFYILMELQSTVDYQMPYRLLLYMVEIWRAIIKDVGKKGGRKEYKLPAIIPCVLYNGRDNWTVCRSFKETLEANELFGENILDFKYILFDVKRYDENKLLELANVIGAAFFIDRKTEHDEMTGRLKTVMIQLLGLDQEERALFFTWFKNIAIRNMPVEKAEELKKVIEERREGIGMIYAIDEAIQNEYKKREKEGMEKGIEKTARNFLDMGMTIEQVAKGTGLSCERLRELKCKEN
jgi:predicted transposase/invertase (TIGR01784 family)